MADDALYAFEKIPHRRLSIKVNRGKFFSALVAEIQAFSEQADGKTALSLADLGTFPDEEIAAMIPVVVSDCQITLVNNHVYGQPPFTMHPIELFPIDIPALSIFNMFNGMTTIADASQCLALETGWDLDHAFAYTRGVFLWLVLAGICRPSGF